MHRRQFLISTAALAGAMSAGPMLSRCTAHSKKPNILLILTDDQGWGDITSHNNPRVHTPTMDRLAAEGARFDRFYVSPVCAPTRASLLTGRYHPRTGVHGVTRGRETMREDEVTIAEILKKNGYATGAFGKWHNGAHYPQHPNGQGFDEFVGFCAGHWNNYFSTKLERNGVEFTSEGYIADYLTDQAIRFIKKNKNNPFFCYVPYNPPHSPFQAPDNYFDKYKAQGLNDELACVYAMCENLDDNIARLLDTLRDNDLTDDTIVIFITDNGPNTDRYNGDMRGRKGSPHEGGSRVPCFIRWPGHIEPGTVITPITAHIDILPTLVDMLDLPTPQTRPLDGVSLAPLLANPTAPWPDRMIFGKWNQAGYVRTPRYRLIAYPNGIELYDMKNDPGEKRDLANEKPDIAQQLKAAYDAWWQDVIRDGFDPIPTAIGYEQAPKVVLPGHEAFLLPEVGRGISYQDKYGWANDWITNWTSTEAYPQWPVKIVRDGDYEVSIDYVCAPENVGVRFRVVLGEASIGGTITEAHNPPHLPSPDRVTRKEVYEKEWKRLTLGQVKLQRGIADLKIVLESIPGRQAMDVKAVRVRLLQK